jgi:hypothetical protein
VFSSVVFPEPDGPCAITRLVSTMNTVPISHTYHQRHHFPWAHYPGHVNKNVSSPRLSFRIHRRNEFIQLLEDNSKLSAYTFVVSISAPRTHVGKRCAITYGLESTSASALSPLFSKAISRSWVSKRPVSGMLMFRVCSMCVCAVANSAPVSYSTPV